MKPAVLVTGAGGFVGGHIARSLAKAGYDVRALRRRPVEPEPGDPPLAWIEGDLRDAGVRRAAVAGCWGVVHAAGWVRLGRDRRDQAHAINVEATAGLLSEARAAGVERFVHTSTLWTAAAGTPETPAVEATPWNLGPIRSPYSETKREAERRVLDAATPGFRTCAICPALTIGPRDPGPTSTRVLLDLARRPLVALPGGGIPVVDAAVLARAHVRALEVGELGRRYLVAGPYLSYGDLAALVAQVAGRPRRIVRLPDGFEPPLRAIGTLIDRCGLDRSGNMSAAAVSGGFLRLHASGAHADAVFGLDHPPPIRSIFEALDDHRRAGRAPWLTLCEPHTIAACHPEH